VALGYGYGFGYGNSVAPYGRQRCRVLRNYPDPGGERFGPARQRLQFREQAMAQILEFVIQNRNLEYGERRCGFNTKHQSTKAPKGGGVDLTEFEMSVMVSLVLSVKRFFMHVVVACRVTSLIRKCPPLYEHHRVPGIGLL